MNITNGFAVIFDTNAYRNVVSEINIKDLITLEKSNQIQPYANPFVMCELLSHLADTNDKFYQECKSAVIALAEHCAIQGNGGQIAISSDSESQMCETLFGKHPSGHQSTVENLGRICFYIFTNRAESDIDKIRGDLHKVAAAVEQNEQRFIDEMMKYVVKGFDPAASDWAPLKKNKRLRNKALKFLRDPISLSLLSIFYAIKTYILLNEQIDDLLDAKSKLFLKNFQTPLRLYNEIVKRIVETGCDISKGNRRNWIWDIQIAFVAVKDNCLIQNRKVRMITNDGDIVEAAKQANCGNNVYHLKEYIIALKNNAFH